MGSDADAILFVILLVVVPIWFLVLLVRTPRKPPEMTWPMHLRQMAGPWCGWLFAAVLLALLLPLLSPPHHAAKRAQCTNNLKQIGLALHNYHDAYDCFPPAYTTDAEGQPLHSWRALLLPYLEEEALYQRLRLDEPWDSPHNQSAVETGHQGRTPAFYRCPSEEEDPDGNTSYVMLVGPGSMSDGGSSNRFEQFTDGTSYTAIVVEMDQSCIHWTEPRDLDIAKMSFKLNDPDDPSIRSGHPSVANVLIADGSVQTLSKETDPDDLRALTTIAGGDDVGRLFE